MPYERGDRVIVRKSGFRGEVVADEEPGELVRVRCKGVDSAYPAADLDPDPDGTLPPRATGE